MDKNTFKIISLKIFGFPIKLDGLLFATSQFAFLAQLWKQNGDKLENKNGDWMYMKEKWILPNEDQAGELITNNTKRQQDCAKLTFFRFTTMETR